MASTLRPLMMILFATWLLILGGSVIVFKLIVPIPDLYEGRIGLIVTAILKAGASVALVLVWVWIMVNLRNLYVKRILKPVSSD
ncbi:MAG: hypothetical protein HYU39_07750 [Thaumarchaeota archaeon]|nr:hypothetical protein [Nitrososphaerota archaeon]